MWAKAERPAGVPIQLTPVGGVATIMADCVAPACSRLCRISVHLHPASPAWRVRGTQ